MSALSGDWLGAVGIDLGPAFLTAEHMLRASRLGRRLGLLMADSFQVGLVAGGICHFDHLLCATKNSSNPANPLFLPPSSDHASGLTRCPVSLPGLGLHPGPGLLLPRRPHRLLRVENTRSPRFLGDPCLHAPFFDPGGPLTPGPFRLSHAAFR